MTLDDIFNEQEEKKDAVKPVSSSSLTINDIFGEEETIKKPVYKSDVERFKEDINRRKENIQQIANREIEGKQGKVSSFLQTTGQVLGVATDFVGEAIVTVGQLVKRGLYDPLPEHSKQKFRTEFIEPVKKGIIEPISNKISTGEQTTIKQSLQDRDLPSLVSGQVNKYQSFKEKNPETANNIEAGLNIIDFIDTFAVAPALIKGATKKVVKEAGQETFEQTQKKATKEISKKIKKEALEIDYSSKKLTKSFLGSMTSKDVDKYKDDLSRVLSFVTDNDKAVISKSKNATDDFINVFQKNRTDIGNVADSLARQVDDVVDVEMYYIGNELEKKFKDRLKSLSVDIKKSGDKVAGKEYAYINDYIKQIKASQNYSASESFDRLKKLNAELSDYYTRKKQPGFNPTKKEKVSIELKAGEADILRNRLYFKMDNALGNNMFSRIRRAQEAFENVNSKVLPKIKQRNKLASLDLNEDSFIRGINAATKAIRVDQPLTIPGKLINTGKTFLRLEDTKLNDTIKNAFKNLPTKQGVPIKDLITDITDISLKNLDIIKEERYMSDFLQELWKNQDVALLPPPSVIIMPEFSDSAYKAMKEVKLTPPEIVNDNINYQIWVNELNRRPEIKLLTEKATPTSIGTTANPIIPKAPTTYEKPAAKIGTTDTSIVEPKASSMSSELIEEAKKYDNVDDFIKAQGELLYHGTSAKFDKFDKKMIGSTQGYKESGFFFTDDLESAKSYNADYIQKPKYAMTKEEISNNKNLNVVKAYIDTNGFISMQDLADMYNKGIIKTKPDFSKSFRPESFFDNNRASISEAIEKGVNGIKHTAEGETVYMVSDPSKIKTESQLKDIYNQAKKTK